MIKKKKLEESRDEERLEEEDIIELDEVVDEPDELPVGEDLDEMLFGKDDDVSIDEADIEELDLDLGIKEESEEVEEEVSEPEPVEEKDVATGKSAQDVIDSLFKEALLEKEEAGGAEELKETPVEVPDLDEIVDRIEERILSKFEEFVEARLPELVLRAVKQELEALKKELEKEL